MMYSFVLSLCSSSYSCFFSFYNSGPPVDLHSFPTRRSSDLGADALLAVDLDGLRHDRAAADLRRRRVPVDRLADRGGPPHLVGLGRDRKSTRLNSSHVAISYAVFCLKKKKESETDSGAKLIACS